MPIRTERTVFTIEIFSVTWYLDGTQLDPDDGSWFPIIDHGSVVEFNSHDEAIKYIKGLIQPERLYNDILTLNELIT